MLHALDSPDKDIKDAAIRAAANSGGTLLRRARPKLAEIVDDEKASPEIRKLADETFRLLNP